MKIFAIALIAVFIGNGCAITGNTAKEPGEEHFNYSILFCDNSNCLNGLLGRISNSEEASCALYNADQGVVDAIDAKGALITDKNSKSSGNNVIKRKSSGLMHNKFCVFDKSIVWTGSLNPTSRKNVLDDVVIINSTILANNYLEEFEELKSDSSVKTAATKIILNSTLVENYFCPEDSCIDALQNKLSQAEESIYFAAYSFTHPKIANELIIRNSAGIAVKGIIEKGNEYSQLLPLQLNNLAVIEDNSTRLMHHKFFIIDNKIVITGSFNPTRNGDKGNDENMLVIHNEEVAGIYFDYFDKLLK